MAKPCRNNKQEPRDAGWRTAIIRNHFTRFASGL
jgi:hypothetical protein